MIVDNLLNASEETLNRIELISGKRPGFFNIDIKKEEEIDRVFEAHPDIDSVIHFAALKVGGEPSRSQSDCPSDSASIIWFVGHRTCADYPRR